jgi:hypothetical protein
MDHTSLTKLRANRLIAFNNMYLKNDKARISKTTSSSQYFNQLNGGMRIIEKSKVISSHWAISRV